MNTHTLTNGVSVLTFVIDDAGSEAIVTKSAGGSPYWTRRFPIDEARSFWKDANHIGKVAVATGDQPILRFSERIFNRYPSSHVSPVASDDFDHVCDEMCSEFD